jgi:hypothetical protein
MNEEVKIDFNVDFIEVRHPKGYRIEPQSMDKYWTMLGNACAEHNCNLVLVEAEAPRRDMTTMDAFGSGIRAAEVAVTLKLALCFSNYEPDELSEFFKTVAYNRGVRAEFFAKRADALKWLGVSERKTRSDAA